jgi:hypothetical protein
MIVNVVNISEDFLKPMCWGCLHSMWKFNVESVFPKLCENQWDWDVFTETKPMLWSLKD